VLRQDDVLVEAASRTDAGVHARANVCCFAVTEAPRDLAQFAYSLNQLLPPEVCVQAVAPAAADFDVRGTRGKEYRYQVNFVPRREPLGRLHEWQIPARRGRPPWDGAAAARAAALLRGTHSFEAFGNTPRGKERLVPVQAACTLQMLQLRQLSPTAVQFRLRGDRFLYKMVRNVVGALVRVGHGELSEGELVEALECGRFPSSDSLPITAPPHGLVLHSVLYPHGCDPFSSAGSGGTTRHSMTRGLRPWRTRTIRASGLVRSVPES
jgi:tRNA pseudouridine38-40 synthase